MQSTREKILALLWQAQELLEAGDFTIDGLPTSDDILADAIAEMQGTLDNASETIAYYMDKERVHG